MSLEIDRSIRCRNYAEELRIMAADQATPENRETLRRIAEDYERAAGLLEAVDQSKRAAGLR